MRADVFGCHVWRLDTKLIRPGVYGSLTGPSNGEYQIADDCITSVQ